jgi:hypothetical protein
MLSDLGLPADNKALHQWLGEVRGTHALLDRGNVVRNAPEFNGLMLEIGDSETGPRVTVPGLANGAGIKKIAPRLFNAQSAKSFRGARTNLKNLEIGILIREAALVMGVAEKSDFSGGVKQTIQSLRGREDVFVFVLKRAMYQNNTVSGERSVRQLGKPGEILGVQLRASPIHSGFRHGIKIGRIHEPCDGFVVIPADSLRAHFAKTSDHFMRVGPVSDDVSKTHGNVPAAVCSIESSGESRGVCVKIAKDKNAHSCHPQNVIEYR